MLESVVVYWYIAPNSDTWLSGSNLCRYAPMPPKAVPSFGLDDTTGTRSHGDDFLAGGAAAAWPTATATQMRKSIMPKSTITPPQTKEMRNGTTSGVVSGSGGNPSCHFPISRAAD